MAAEVGSDRCTTVTATASKSCATLHIGSFQLNGHDSEATAAREGGSCNGSCRKVELNDCSVLVRRIKGEPSTEGRRTIGLRSDYDQTDEEKKKNARQKTDSHRESKW